MKLKIINNSKNEMPAYATAGSAGFDLRANIKEPITLQNGERRLFPTGLSMEIEVGYEGQVRPRSGLAFKQGLTVLNSPGTIDSDYRGDVGVILINLSGTAQIINPGDRIAQMVFAKYEIAEIESTSELSSTERGDGGFGSTGKQ